MIPISALSSLTWASSLSRSWAGDKLRQVQEEMGQLDMDLEDNMSERNQKYRELKKREETMDAFLGSFESNREEELERLQSLEEQITRMLSTMSSSLETAGHLPSSQTFSSMKDDLAFKEGELEKSKNTLEGLNREHQQLALNLEKIEALEDKIKTEMATLKEKMSHMDEEMVTFTDLDKLRREAEEKRRSLEEEQEELNGRREGVMQNLHEVQLSYESLKVNGPIDNLVIRTSKSLLIVCRKLSMTTRRTCSSPTSRGSGR